MEQERTDKSSSEGIQIPTKYVHFYSDNVLRETAARVAEKQREQKENPWIFAEYCRTILALYQREASRGQLCNSLPDAA